MHVIATRPQFVGVRTHRGEKQHDLLLMMSLIGAKTHVLRHEDGSGVRGRKMLQWKELVAEDCEHKKASSSGPLVSPDRALNKGNFL